MARRGEFSAFDHWCDVCERTLRPSAWQLAWGIALSEYKLRYLDAGGAVQREQLVLCDNDDEAIDRAGRNSHPHQLEVWCGAKRIAQFGALLKRGLNTFD
jgi:hypothetical protein